MVSGEVANASKAHLFIKILFSLSKLLTFNALLPLHLHVLCCQLNLIDKGVQRNDG
eukprot:m.123846 g.123846  ORF g.123846 m.123846 type:complete len:56 (-) comp12950_c0_seq17:1469-1636(-)